MTGADTRGRKPSPRAGLSAIGFPDLGTHASNALLVHPSRSVTGNALEIGATTSGPTIGLAGVPVFDNPTVNNHSSSFADFATYLFHVVKLGDPSRPYCDDVSTAATEAVAARSWTLRGPRSTSLAAVQGATLTGYTWPADVIRFEAQGADSVPEIPWQKPRDVQPRCRDHRRPLTRLGGFLAFTGRR